MEWTSFISVLTLIHVDCCAKSYSLGEIKKVSISEDILKKYREIFSLLSLVGALRFGDCDHY